VNADIAGSGSAEYEAVTDGEWVTVTLFDTVLVRDGECVTETLEDVECVGDDEYV